MKQKGSYTKKKPSRMARTIVRIVNSFLLMLFLTIGIVAFYIYTQMQPVESGETAATKQVTIPSGASLPEIGTLLEKEKIIKNGSLFTYYVKLFQSDASNHLQAGEYALHGGYNFDQILDRITEGTVQAEAMRFTIPEGWNVTQIANALEKRGLVNKEAFLREVNEGEFSEYAFVSSIPAQAGRKYRLEGYLFPETYEVRTGATEHEIIAKMLGQFAKEMKPDWQAELNKRNMSIDEAVNLAAIVEREVVVDMERPIVAGVFYNRIRDNWLLQSCATVQFVLGKQRDRITFDDLEIDSPYNTYINKGLPPGPIASPGRASLEAVVYPSKHDYFFFVTKKDGTSEHHFSKTFAEHVSKDAKSRGSW